MYDHSNPAPYFPSNLDDFAPWVAIHGLTAPYGKCQCGCGERTDLAKKTDMRRHIARGKFNRFVQNHHSKRSLSDLFWSNVVAGDKDVCWEWQGFLLDGYGVITRASETVRAHRASYEMHKGPIPEGFFVCHACDNRRCVNPDHLFAGTPNDNAQDMIRKGRDRKVAGEQSPHAKLTTMEVLEIRALRKLGAIRREVAERFGVSLALIDKVASRQAWKHVR